MCGWWFGTFFMFPSIGNSTPNCRTPSFFRGVGIPPTRYGLYQWFYTCYWMGFGLKKTVMVTVWLMGKINRIHGISIQESMYGFNSCSCPDRDQGEDFYVEVHCAEGYHGRAKALPCLHLSGNQGEAT